MVGSVIVNSTGVVQTFICDSCQNSIHPDKKRPSVSPNGFGRCILCHEDARAGSIVEHEAGWIGLVYRSKHERVWDALTDQERRNVLNQFTMTSDYPSCVSWDNLDYSLKRAILFTKAVKGIE